MDKTTNGVIFVDALPGIGSRSVEPGLKASVNDVGGDRQVEGDRSGSGTRDV